MLYVNPQLSPAFQGKGLTTGSKQRETEVLQEYEQLFVFQMIKEMRKTVPDYGVMDNSQREYFDEMMDDFLAGEIAKSGQFGIAKQLSEQIAVQAKGAVGLASNGEALGGIPLHRTVTGIVVGETLSTGIPVVKRGAGVVLPTLQEAGIALAPSRRGIARYNDMVDRGNTNKLSDK